nr:hypothetical protein [Tanacetum cinerariifolium]
MRPFCCPVTIPNTLDSVGSGPTWLFDIDSLTRTMNYQPVTVRNQTNPRAGFQDKSVVEKAGEDIDQQYEPNLDTKKPESEVNVSPSSSAHSRKQDDKTKKEAKGKSHVESFTGYRDLSVEFEDFSDNSINEVNAAGTLVPSVGQIFHNSTNTFSVAGPSNATASPTYRKSSFIDASQLPDDPDMPELEDITYSDDEDDVGAEADFNNLETSITVSPIPTSRVHKDHPVTQIIGGLSLTTQTRSMTKVVKDQGKEGCASWDLGKGTWGGREKGFGTVPVWCRCTGSGVGDGVVLARKWVEATIWVVKVLGNQSNLSACVQEQFNAEKTGEKNVPQYVLFPVWSSGSTNPHNTDGDVAFDKKEATD